MKEEKRYCIYIHIFPNNKVYVGQTCQKVERRWRKGEGYIDCRLVYNAIQKYGWENIKHEILYENLSLEQANTLEKALILYVYKSNLRENGYNISDGGGSGINSNQGYHWYNNGVIEKRFKECPGPEWTKGQLLSHYKNLCKPRIVNGKTYESLKAVMKEFNISKHQAEFLCGMKIRKDTRIKIKINGIEYSSIQEAHRQTGISIRQINKMRGTYILKGYNHNRITKQCKSVIIDGIQYKSFYRAEQELGISRRLIAAKYKKFGKVLTLNQILNDK